MSYYCLKCQETKEMASKILDGQYRNLDYKVMSENSKLKYAVSEFCRLWQEGNGNNIRPPRYSDQMAAQQIFEVAKALGLME